MKKNLFLVVAAVMMAACGNGDELAGSGESEGVKDVTFEVNGDFAVRFSDMETRTVLADEGNTMTDLWMFDFVGDECVQTLHQTSADADWGTPSVSLKYGSHHVYFVVSRGTGASLNNESHEIVWSRPSDTFWKDLVIDVNGSTNGTRTVELDRIATRLRVTATDEVPGDISTITITPSVWYNGIN